MATAIGVEPDLPAYVRPPHPSLQDLTQVDLEFIEGTRSHRLIFGNPTQVIYREHHAGITRRTAFFARGARFGLELWDGKTVLSRARVPVARTTRWRILILEAGSVHSGVSQVKGVRPGAHILMQATRTPTCQLLKAWLVALERDRDLADLPREFFLSRDLRLQATRRSDGPAALGSLTR